MKISKQYTQQSQQDDYTSDKRKEAKAHKAFRDMRKSKKNQWQLAD
jgi:hypothetical protein